ncbi:MAG: TonB-dependent receptor [Anaeromyxobacter sp.]|nr:TonB-dependent receptor [Anaeromyxobacter sp.]MBL0274862.1 TonB-dependent receptor [Anaeromyxobacter sp.]
MPCRAAWPVLAALLSAAPALLPAALAASPSPARAAAAVALELPEQPLDTSLAAVAKACGLDLVWDPAITAGKRAPALSGTLTAQQALSRLLHGSGLSATFSGEGRAVLSVAPPPPRTGAAPKPQSAELEEVGIVGERDLGYAVSAAATGTKTDTPLLETPLAVQVLPQEVLQDQRATTLDRALENVSGVHAVATPGNNELIYLRGFYTLTTFRDGVRIEEYVGSGQRTLANVERVEVLKGPAAILYGRVEPGGIVNLVTRQPGATAAYSLEQVVGSWDQFVTTAGATGPLLGDTLLYRLDASYEKTGSWRQGIHAEKLFLAPVLTWRPTARTSITAQAEYIHNPSVYDSMQNVPFDATTGQLIPLPRRQNLSPPSHLKYDTTHLELRLLQALAEGWQVDARLVRHAVKNEGAYYQAADFSPDGAGGWTVTSSLTSQKVEQNTLAAIVDVTGHFETFGLRHTLLVGADWYRFETPLTAWLSADVSTTDAFHPAPPPLSIDPTLWFGADATTDHLGVYAQDQVALPLGLHALAGLRYQRVKRTGSQSFGPGLGGDGSAIPDEPQDDQAVTPRAGLLWQAGGAVSLYANYAENFGANTGFDWQGAPLDPERAQQGEVGAKVQLLGGKLSGSLALYQLTKQNVAVDDVQHPGFRINVGEIRSRGPELDLQGELLPGWSVLASYTYTDVEVTKSTPGSAFAEGNRMANVPRNMASLWTTYALQSLLPGLKLGGGLSWRDASTDPTNTLATPGYTLVDAMAAYRLGLGRGHLSAQVNVSNLLDVTYHQNAQAVGSVGYLTYGAPRAVTASVRLDL